MIPAHAIIAALSVHNFEGGKIIVKLFDLDNLIKLFPNPTDGLVHLNSEDNYKIDVFDNIGKLVLTTIGNSFNIQSLEKGSYFIKLASDNNTISTYKILRK